jgi:hypothetical protein
MPKRISAMASAMSSTRMQRLDELGGVGQACIMAWRVLPNRVHFVAFARFWLLRPMHL